jgi:hypothetical protein
MSRQIVLTRCNEPESMFEWLKDFVDKPEVVIYNKGNSSFGLPAQARPNVGRDLETQLWHILTNYDNLADELLMLQPRFDDHLDWPRWAGEDDIDFNRLPKSILNHEYDGSILQYINVYHTECYNPHNVSVPGVITRDYWEMQTSINQEYLDGLNSLVKTNYTVDDVICWTFSPGIAYSVPKSMILNKSKAWWQRCYDFYMSAPPPHCHAYFYERCYPLLWNYSEY